MHRPVSYALASFLPAILAAGSAPAQAPPQVVALSPADGACDVDAGKTTELVVTFDQPMRAGRSVVGGGPNFPKISALRWQDPKTLVIAVELQADHDYRLGLNSHTFTNFRSRQGVALVPVGWAFTTLPAELPDPRAQQRRNRAAFAELQELLPRSYSYYDLRVKDWHKTFAAAKQGLLAAPTDVAWASLAARMLEPTADIHLHLRCGERFFATGRRAVDPLFRGKLLPKYFEVQQLGRQAAWGRTLDEIGYLLIATWTQDVDLDAVEQALAGLRDCKAMVIDARPNSGGGEDLALRIAAWFVTGTRVYAKHRYRTGVGKDAFGPVLDRTITGNEGEQRFTGPIAVLTSRYVMSSNEAFVLMLHKADDCVQVGQPTYGSSGNPQPHELANGVTVVLPSWQALRPDGTCFEGEGIAPDVLVEATAQDLEQRDPILEQGLELLRAKIGK